MSISVFKKWTSAVLYLNEKIKRNSLIAGRNIKLENTGNGIKIHGSAESTPGGDSYNGYFKLVKTDDDKIKIIDGFNDTAANAAKVNVNYFPVTVAASEFTITADSFIYLECQLKYEVEGSPNATGASATIIQSATELESEAGTFRALISRVTFEAGAIDFSRENVPLNILMSGACS